MDPDILLKQDVYRAGYYADGTITNSVTMVLTVELEREREANLDLHIKALLARTDYERWSWEGCTSMSSMWLHLPLDQFRYIKDPLFGVMFATYLG